MSWAAKNNIDRLLGIGGTGPRDLALVEERLSALQPRMPWIYAMLVSCQFGMLFTFELERATPVVAVVMILFSSLRGIMWIRIRNHDVVGEAARNRLRSIGLGSVISTLAMAVLISLIAPTLDPQHVQLMMVMTATCAIALSAPMSVLPRSALVTYLVVGIPAALCGVIAGTDRLAAVASFNLLLCIILLTYLVRIQDRGFVDRVNARLDGQLERARAEHAERIAIEERTVARAVAQTDFLTGLANRRAFLAALLERDGAAIDSVMLFDLDGFKPVNDTFGHEGGDALLKNVATRLIATGCDGAVAARLGGDEFALLIPAIASNAAEALAQQIVARLSQPYAIGKALVSVSACCGIATVPAGDRDASRALREADLALYKAKANGRASVSHYSDGMGLQLVRRAEIESALRAPGVEQEIELLFQPIINLATGRIEAFEALARWTHSRLGPIAPADFIPITEQMQLVEPISQALLRRAAGTAQCWPEHVRLSFNLSAVQLCSWGSAQRILRCLDEAGLPPARLQIEVTETAMMADIETARTNLKALHERGVGVALDDFGAGYASISYLREFAFDKLKLDGSLVMASSNPQGERLLKGVIDLAHAVGIPCIAEHVETAEQARYLARIGCEYGQGYFLGRPVDERQALILVASGSPPDRHRAVREQRVA